MIQIVDVLKGLLRILFRKLRVKKSHRVQYISTNEDMAYIVEPNGAKDLIAPTIWRFNG